MPSEEQPVAKTWNGLVGRLEQLFKDALAIELDDKPKTKDSAYVKGYKAGHKAGREAVLKLALDVVKEMRVDESRQRQPAEDFH